MMLMKSAKDAVREDVLYEQILFGSGISKIILIFADSLIGRDNNANLI